MGNLYPTPHKDNRLPRSRFSDDDGFDGDLDPGVIHILEENARLRALVTQLSCLVLKHVAEQK